MDTICASSSSALPSSSTQPCPAALICMLAVLLLASLALVQGALCALLLGPKAVALPV